MHYDVIVIGGGNGGLSVGATLAKKGKKICLLERHNIPGGVVQVLDVEDLNLKLLCISSVPWEQKNLQDQLERFLKN
ncbi:NAD(P)-binding protein [Clostridium botulinum]|uniref:NAD(P)-binding protein n=1 Tax=Clostridium botulinum TaxID=1491 RepID=UPI0021B40B74|nr:NAD(P)-binding protein [Clostridium botulinum]